MQRDPHGDLNNNNSSDAIHTLEALNRAEQNSRSERSAQKAPSMRTGSVRNAQSSANRQRSSSSASQTRKSSAASRPGRTGAPQSRNSAASNAQRKRTASQSRNSRQQMDARERRLRQEAQASRRNSSSSPGASKKKRSGFKKFLLIYSAILVIILIVGLIVFSSFIGTYEKNQPVNIAMYVSEELSGDNAKAYLENNKDLIKTMEDADVLIDKCVSNLQGKTLSFIQSETYTDEKPEYNITADGSMVARVGLEDDGRGAFGLKQWKLSSLDIASYIPDTYSYTILCPPEDTVYVNGTELSEDFITAKNEVPAILENVTDLLSTVPKYDSYTVSGFLEIPTVTAKDASGSDVGVAASTDSFVVGGKASQEFINEQKDFVENALTAWAYHFINYGTMSLASYVTSDTDLYAYIFGSDTMDPILTSLYDWEYISNVTMTEFSADNYIKYTDDCYSVDVKYHLSVDFNNGNPTDDDQQLDATWVIVKYNNFWGIADIQYHQNGTVSLADSVKEQSSADSTDAADTETTTASDTETT